MVGMRDVAKAAGVSLSTVSLVVNNSGYVSADMRAKVEAAMKTLDYVPNELARNLSRNRTNIIGLIVPTIRHPFFASLVAALQRHFAEAGLHTMLCSVADEERSEGQYIDMLQRRMMDGVVMAAHTEYPEDYWVSIGRPVVFFDRYLGIGIPSVSSDHAQGGRLIAEHLLATGARHVVSIGGPRSQFEDLGDEDRTSFPTVRFHLTMERILDEHGVRCDYMEAGAVSDMDRYGEVARELFERYPDIDAVIGSDAVAAYCVQEAARRGIAVPDRLQVIAYDGTYAADLAGKRLTCVRQDFDALASRIVERLKQIIDERPIGDESDTTPVYFVPGETTRAA